MTPRTMCRQACRGPRRLGAPLSRVAAPDPANPDPLQAVNLLSAIDPFALVVAHRRRKTVAPFLIPQRVPANARVALYSADNKQGFAP